MVREEARDKYTSTLRSSLYVEELSDRQWSSMYLCALKRIVWEGQNGGGGEPISFRHSHPSRLSFIGFGCSGKTFVLCTLHGFEKRILA